MRESPPCWFHDEQRLEVPRLRIALAILPLLVTALAIARVTVPGIVRRLPVSAADLIFFTLLLWIVFAWLLRVRLVVDAGATGVSVRLRGLPWRDDVPVGGWRRASLVSFDARRDFGGYGLRRAGPLRAYVAAGTTGVELELSDGGVMIVGSARAADLLTAIERAARGR